MGLKGNTETMNKIPVKRKNEDDKKCMKVSIG